MMPETGSTWGCRPGEWPPRPLGDPQPAEGRPRARARPRPDPGPRRAGRPPGTRTVGGVVAGRLGHEVVERLVDPLIGGIHAGGVDGLSAESTFPPLLVVERRSGSLILRRLRLPAPFPVSRTPAPATPVFWSLDGGTARLPAALAAAAGRPGGWPLHTGVAVEAPRAHRPRGGGGDLAPDPGRRGRRRGRGVGRCGRTADPPRSTGGLWPCPPVQAGGPPPLPHAPRGRGPAGRGAPLARSPSSPWPSGRRRSPSAGRYRIPRPADHDDRRPPGAHDGVHLPVPEVAGLARPGDELLRVSIGRFHDERADQLGDEELAASAFGELAPVLGLRGAPLETRVTRWHGAFPQYRGGPPHPRGDRREGGGRTARPGGGGRRLPGRGHPGVHRERPGGRPHRARVAGGRARPADG